MSEVCFRTVQSDEDVALLDKALRCLSADLGDDHIAGHDALTTALRGACPSAHGIVALEGAALCGAVLFSPVFSTVRGAPGLYVSDLWVSDEARGMGLGPRLLASAARRAGQLWGANWLTLAVYHTSPRSRRFYERLGFKSDTGASVMKLGAEGLGQLMRDAG